MPLAGKRVLSLESRRANETADLIRKHAGEPVVAPSMREVPLERNEEALAFAEKLFTGQYDMVILFTGVGTRFLAKVIASRYPEDRFPAALRSLTTVVRGPKPNAVLREMGVTATILVPEPNTWREILIETEGRPERRIAVQEYGRSNEELLAALRARGAEVTPVRVYQWELPEDIGPLKNAAQQLADGTIDVVLFTTSIQIHHLLEIAESMHLRPAVEAGLRQAFLASIGPTTSDALTEAGFPPAMEPSHPKLGILVKEVAERF